MNQLSLENFPEACVVGFPATPMEHAPIELLAENGDHYQSCRLGYHGGEKYPVLERDAAIPD